MPLNCHWPQAISWCARFQMSNCHAIVNGNCPRNALCFQVVYDGLNELVINWSPALPLSPASLEFLPLDILPFVQFSALAVEDPHMETQLQETGRVIGRSPGVHLVGHRATNGIREHVPEPFRSGGRDASGIRSKSFLSSEDWIWLDDSCCNASHSSVQHLIVLRNLPQIFSSSTLRTRWYFGYLGCCSCCIWYKMQMPNMNTTLASDAKIAQISAVQL